MSYIAQDEWSITPHTRFLYGGRYQVPGMGLDNTFTYAFGVEHDLGTQYLPLRALRQRGRLSDSGCVGLQSAAGD